MQRFLRKAASWEHGFESDGIALFGILKGKKPSTRFFHYADMRIAIEKARMEYAARGLTGQASIDVPFDDIIGEGYYRKSGQIGVSNTVRVFFDEFGLPVSAFPNLPALPKVP